MKCPIEVLQNILLCNKLSLNKFDFVESILFDFK